MSYLTQLKDAWKQGSAESLTLTDELRAAKSTVAKVTKATKDKAVDAKENAGATVGAARTAYGMFRMARQLTSQLALVMDDDDEEED